MKSFRTYVYRNVFLYIDPYKFWDDISSVYAIFKSVICELTLSPGAKPAITRPKLRLPSAKSPSQLNNPFKNYGSRLLSERYIRIRTLCTK